jgi:His/Glu/Gln/Arg/opine family amino acid ABC transporter permease subunit
MDHLAISIPPHAPVRPKRRRARSAYIIRQGLIIAAALILLVVFAAAVRAGLARNGIGFDMGFLLRQANFEISEGVLPTWAGWRQFSSSDSNGQALLVGFFNTLKVSAVAIALSTLMGVSWGVARVSHNWLLRQASFLVVEFVRNTPLLIQLVFWYFAVALKMPGLTEASSHLGALFSQQGIFLPWIRVSESTSVLSASALILSILVLVAAGRFRRPRRWLLALAGLFAAGSLAHGFPLSVSIPHADGMLVTDGLSLSPEFAALVVALTVYTAAFIAEIVRGAILALPRGQWEAAAALGFGTRTTFKEIVIPQVLRMVLPSFANQYISLVKSTSLGIAIGFSDLFNVYGTVANQSGRSLEGILIVMSSYLVLSWLVSGITNAANSRLLRAGGQR